MTAESSMRHPRMRTIGILLMVGVKYALLAPVYIGPDMVRGLGLGIRHWLSAREIEAYDRIHRLGRYGGDR